MTNKQTLAALQEAIKYGESTYSTEHKYNALRDSVKALIAALEVGVKEEDVCTK